MNWRARPRVNTNHERNLLNNVHLHLLPKYKIYPLNNAVSCLMEKSSEQKNLFGTDATIYKLKSLFWGLLFAPKLINVQRRPNLTIMTS